MDLKKFINTNRDGEGGLIKEVWIRWAWE